MTTISGAAWRRDPGLPHQRLEEDTIVVDPRRREVHLLNETVTRVWELEQGLRVTGVALTPAGAPVAGAPIEVDPVDEPFGRARVGQVGRAPR